MNLGIACWELGNFDKAIALQRRALGLRPGYAEAHMNLGNALRERGRLAEATAAYGEAIGYNQTLPEAYNNLGVALMQRGRFAEAGACFAAALAVQRNNADARVNRALTLLVAGDFATGWEEYGWRWKTKAFLRSAPDGALWRGQDIAGQTILLHAEQGRGDTIQFCRYVPLVARRGARVVLEVEDDLVELMRSLDPSITVIERGRGRPPFDWHCPLLSLPHAFGTVLDTIPGATPYLRADPARVDAWAARLAGLRGLRVGLAWARNPRVGASHPSQSAARCRSIPLAELAPLAEVPGVTFVSLQKGAAAEATPPAGMALHNWTAELVSFADTVALVEAVDLVVTVDTSVAHLAGALGKEVWLLNRYDTCWRWLLDRDDSPWYPTMLFRQRQPGRWAPVVQQVRSALADRAGAEAGSMAGADVV